MNHFFSAPLSLITPPAKLSRTYLYSTKSAIWAWFWPFSVLKSGFQMFSKRLTDWNRFYRVLWAVLMHSSLLNALKRIWHFEITDFVKVCFQFHRVNQAVGNGEIITVFREMNWKSLNSSRFTFDKHLESAVTRENLFFASFLELYSGICVQILRCRNKLLPSVL